MRRHRAAALPLIVGVAATVLAPAGRANDVVTYEVVSDSIPQANVEYVDASGRKLLESVPLPWRLEVTLDDARGPTGRGAQVPRRLAPIEVEVADGYRPHLSRLKPVVPEHP